jgi:hypothetical protein
MKHLIIAILLLTLLISSCSKEIDYIRLNIIETSTTTEQSTTTLVKTETVTCLTTETAIETVYSGKIEQFKSLNELRDWLDKIEPELESSKKPDWICQDFAWWLVERALRDCKLMTYYSLDAKNYYSLFGVEIKSAHAITATYIQGYTYLIEPQGLEVFPDWNIGG